MPQTVATQPATSRAVFIHPALSCTQSLTLSQTPSFSPSWSMAYRMDSRARLAAASRTVLAALSRFLARSSVVAAAAWRFSSFLRRASSSGVSSGSRSRAPALAFCSSTASRASRSALSAIVWARYSSDAYCCEQPASDTFSPSASAAAS